MREGRPSIAKSLKRHGFRDAAPIHGDLDQATRTRTLEAFRKGELKLLVASDVAARGLDIPDVSHIFNFDVPHHADDYVHRIGRTGRAGKSGVALTIVTRADQKAIAEIERLIARKIDWQEGAELPPEGEDETPVRDARGGRARRQRGEHKARGGTRDAASARSTWRRARGPKCARNERPSRAATTPPARRRSGSQWNKSAPQPDMRRASASRSPAGTSLARVASPTGR